jgi:hypothetical protein
MITGPVSNIAPPRTTKTQDSNATQKRVPAYMPYMLALSQMMASIRQHMSGFRERYIQGNPAVNKPPVSSTKGSKAPQGPTLVFGGSKTSKKSKESKEAKEANENPLHKRVLSVIQSENICTAGEQTERRTHYYWLSKFHVDTGSKTWQFNERTHWKYEKRPDPTSPKNIPPGYRFTHDDMAKRIQSVVGTDSYNADAFKETPMVSFINGDGYRETWQRANGKYEDGKWTLMGIEDAKYFDFLGGIDGSHVRNKLEPVKDNTPHPPTPDEKVDGKTPDQWDNPYDDGPSDSETVDV